LNDPLTVQASRRGRLFLILLLVAVIAAVCAMLFAPREPLARGHRLSHWLRIAAQDGIVTTNEEAAIREIGAAAIPVLLARLHAAKSAREKIIPAWNDLVEAVAPNGSKKTLQTDPTREARLRAEYLNGFRVLGTNAAAAIPALRELLNDEKYASDAIQCLRFVQTDEALAALIPTLSHSNPSVRRDAVLAVADFRERAVRAAEQFATLTNDRDEETARAATWHVGDLLPAQRAIPLLLEKLHDPRPRVVQAAIVGFYAKGPAAEAAMPHIARMFEHDDIKIRRYATNVLVSINPSQVHQFGINTNGMTEHFLQTYQRTRQRLATNTSPWRSW
jgi:HEAT repeat protein